MAEGGVEEMATAYQTATENMCELCLDEDSFKQATWYCKQCRQRLCDKCRKYHRKVPSLKDHEVVQAEEMPHDIPQSTEELSDELRTPMCSTHNLPIELYCEDHNQPVCSSCKLVDHRKCKRLRDLEHVVTENTSKSNDVLQHLEDINRGLSKTEDAMTKESQAVGEQKERVIRKIKDQMQQIEALGYKKILEAEKLFEKEQNSIQKEKDCVKQTMLLVSKSIDEIKTVKQKGSDEELFLARSHVEREAGKYQDILSDTSFITHREVDFTINSSLKDMESLGNIDLKQCKVGVNIEPRATEYLKTKSSAKIYWIGILPGEQIISLNIEETPHVSAHLSLYSRSTGLQSELELPDVAVSADTLNDHRVIVAILDKQCFMTVDIVNNKLVLKNTIQTKGRPILILKYSEQSVIVLVQHMDGTLYFKVIGLRGNVQTDVPINENLVTPVFMRMSKDGDIYITDFTNGCYGFNLNGQTLFHYTQPNAEQYAGLAVDHHNCVYLRIDDQQGKHLTKISPAGQRIQSICHDYGWPMRCDRNKLYLAFTLTKTNNEKAICYINV